MGWLIGCNEANVSTCIYLEAAKLKHPGSNEFFGSEISGRSRIDQQFNRLLLESDERGVRQEFVKEGHLYLPRFHYLLLRGLSKSRKIRAYSYSIFAKLKPFLQCQLTLLFDTECREKMLPSSTRLFNNLCAALSSCQVFQEPVPIKIIINVFRLFVCKGNRDWMQNLLSYLIESPDRSSSSECKLHRREEELP